MSAGWTVEGVLLCPDCTLYIDCFGTLEDQQKLIDAHECRTDGRGSKP